MPTPGLRTICWGYIPDVTSFKPRTSIKLWVSGDWPEWKIRYKLFKRFGVINYRLVKEDAKRKALQDHAKKKKRKREG